MELKPGYKQTEVGVIPEDWDVDVLANVCSKITDGTHDTPRPIETGIPFLTAIHVKENKIDFDGCYYLPQNIHDEIYRRCNPEKDDVLMVNIGAGVATTALVDVNYEFSLKNVALLKPQKSKLIGTYLNHYQSFVKRKITGSISTGGAQPFLSLSQIGQLKIAIPASKAEQTAIANALSDADALIQSLTSLIAKKRQIKQGAMQTLLNPYENGQLKVGWVVKKMSEVCWFQEGPGVRNSQFTRSGVKLLNGTNIDQGELFLEKTDRYISEKEAHGWYSHFLADEGDIIIAYSGITVEKFHEKVTVLRKEHLPLCMNTSTMRFKVTSKELQHSYLKHFLRSKVFKGQIGGKATGSAQLNFGPSHVNAVEMALPPINEQTHIAAILSGMDAEIAALEAKLAKYRHIKQGMMQNLLTGRIRLI